MASRLIQGGEQNKVPREQTEGKKLKDWDKTERFIYSYLELMNKYNTYICICNLSIHSRDGPKSIITNCIPYPA
jgi:hypothetical protein